VGASTVAPVGKALRMRHCGPELARKAALSLGIRVGEHLFINTSFQRGGTTGPPLPLSLTPRFNEVSGSGVEQETVFNGFPACLGPSQAIALASCLYTLTPAFGCTSYGARWSASRFWRKRQRQKFPAISTSNRARRAST